MNAEIKTKWLSALRGGEYKQARGVLKQRADSGFCCLGVLCDLYRKEHPDSSWGERGQFLIGDAEDVFGYLPDSVINWAGLDEENPSLGEGETLASANDHGTTFTQIADIIEAEL